MAFTTLEELKNEVEQRRQAILTLEVDIGGTYSQEHEDAKTELNTAKAMKQITGGQGFLSDNLEELEQRVADTKPESKSVWLQFKKLPLHEWALLVKQANQSPMDQYERVLPSTFIALYGEDPSPETPDGVEPPVVEPLSRDYKLLSSKSGEGILPGPSLHSVVQGFMAWQNSGGDVTIRPTKSGRV